MAFNDKPGGSLRSKRGVAAVLNNALGTVKEEDKKPGTEVDLPQVTNAELDALLSPSEIFNKDTLVGDNGETVEQTLAMQESEVSEPAKPSEVVEQSEPAVASEPTPPTETTEVNTETQEPVVTPVEVVVEPKPSEETLATKQEPVSETLTSATEHSKVETPLAPIPEKVIELEEVETSEPLAEINNQKPSESDSDTFTRLKAATETASLDSSGSYAEMVESMISAQCQKSGVKNLDLSSFGMRAQGLKFPHLSVLEFGKHKFLGAPLVESERNKIVFQLGVHIAQSDKKRIVIKAVREVRDEHNMPLYSLLFDDLVAQQFADMFNYKVLINKDTADVSKLVMVVEKV